MKLTHPDNKQTIEVDNDKTEPYTSQGWLPQARPARKAAAKKTAAKKAPAAPVVDD